MRYGHVYYYKVLKLCCCVAMGNMCCFSGICLCSQENHRSIWFTFPFILLIIFIAAILFLTIGFSVCTPFLYSHIVTIVLN